MSTLFETTGIVLSWRPYREADRWYCVLTKDRGKIECVARGGQKPLAKLTPHLESVAENRLLMVSGVLYYTVAGVERLRAFPQIYEDLTRWTLAHNACSLVDLGMRPEEADVYVYALLEDWLVFLNEIPQIRSERAGFLLASFALKFLRLIGFGPELSVCLSCRGPIEAASYRWHPLKGGVVCAGCVAKDQEQWFSARMIQDDVLKILRFALYEPFSSQLRPHLPAETLSGFHEILESLLVAHFPVIPAVSIREACKHL